MDFWEKMGAVLGCLMVLLVTIAEPIGIYHSFKKHDDGPLSIVVAPLAIYRAFESIWHDDFKDVDWDAQIREDVNACRYFMDADLGNKRVYKDFERFVDEISKYPQDELEKLDFCVRWEMTITELIFHDLIDAIMEDRLEETSILSRYSKWQIKSLSGGDADVVVAMEQWALALAAKSTSLLGGGETKETLKTDLEDILEEKRQVYEYIFDQDFVVLEMLDDGFIESLAPELNRLFEIWERKNMTE